MRVVQTEERGLPSKTDQFFVCVFAKKYVEFVWNVQRRVPKGEVPDGDTEGGTTVQTNRESDLNVGSKSPKVRAICLVKAAKGQRPKQNRPRVGLLHWG